MEEDSDDKQYDPSQKRLDDARKKGEVPRSADMTAAAAYGGFILIAAGFGGANLIGIGALLAGVLARSDLLSTQVFNGGAGPVVGGIMRDLGVRLGPWFLLPAALAVLSLFAQRGIVFAPDKLQFKGSRISPLSTAKQKFGRSGLFEFFKSFAKLCLFSVILGVYLAAKLPDVIATLSMEPSIAVAELLRLTVSLLFIVLAVSLSLGVVDLVWQHAEHIRKHRMSRKEMTDEMKESEGDPHFKGQRRQKGIAIAMNKMLIDTKEADVVIVNPTHYAVALKWDRSGGKAPVCVAKGVDEVAARIREVAIESAVPIRSDPPTARALYATVKIGQEIPPDTYRAVAAAIRFAENIRKKAGRK